MSVLDKAYWYTNRLRSMSISEIRHRLTEYQTIRHERRQTGQYHNGNGGAFPKRDTRITVSGRLLSADLHFYGVAEVTPAKLSQDAVTATLTKANQLLDHRITFFGQTLDLGSAINWHADPLTGRAWPQSFYADIDTRNGEQIGGVKWVWELNRHHHLVTLAKAYHLSRDKRYAGEVCTQLQSWLDQNPPLVGVNWTSALELAIRLINWSWVLAFLGDTTLLTPMLRHVLADAIQQQAAYIARHRSAHSSANNHLIGEAAGLAIAGLAFPWLPEAQTWREESFALLTRELPQQIHADGVPAEQATHYLAFVLDFYLFVWELAKRNGYPPPAIWHTRLAAAANFLNQLMDKQGFIPEIGDSDDAWVVRLDDAQPVNNYRSILTSAAALLQEPSLKRPALTWDEKSYWLLGDWGRERFEQLPTAAQPAVTSVCAEGGYQIMRTEQHVITFDCGPLGYLATAAHGHADALSITLSAGGEPILIDPGTYAYQEGKAWRQFLRSTAAHNTVVVDGLDQSEIQGTFLWGRKATATLIKGHSTPTLDIAIAEHDGYAQRGVIHRRTLLYDKPNCLFVIDELFGEGHHLFEQLWHLPVHATVQLHPEQALLTIGDQRALIVPLAQAHYPTQRTVYCGETGPMQGWVSHHYGHIEAAPVLSLHGEGALPTKLVTAICLNVSGPSANANRQSTLGADQAVALPLADVATLEERLNELMRNSLEN